MPKTRKRQALYFTNPKQLKKSRIMRELRSNARLADVGETVRVLQFPEEEIMVPEMLGVSSSSLILIPKDRRGRGLPEKSCSENSESGSNVAKCADNGAEGASRKSILEPGNVTNKFLFSS